MRPVAVTCAVTPSNFAIHAINRRTGGDAEQVSLPLHEARDRFEQACVLCALELENRNRSRAARLLGMHRNTLLARLAAWGLRPEDTARALPPAAGEGRP